MQIRSIRELVNPKALRPSDRGIVMRERRRANRFSCRIPAVLVVQDQKFPVECTEISKGGLRLQLLRPLPLSAGQHVSVRIRIDAQTFEDACVVARAARNAQGSTLHLRLETNNPAHSSP